MEEHTGERVVHSYDVATHRIPCGATQARSTKHASAVTCAACRELLRPAPRALAGAAAAAGDAHAG